MSFFQRPAPPTWKILLYCVLSAVLLIIFGKVMALFQIVL